MIIIGVKTELYPYNIKFMAENNNPIENKEEKDEEEEAKSPQKKKRFKSKSGRKIDYKGKRSQFKFK